MTQDQAEATALSILDAAENHASMKYGIETGQAIDEQYFNEPTHRAGAAVLNEAFRGRVIYEKETSKFYEKTQGGYYEELSDILSRASEIIDAAAVRAFKKIIDGLTGSALQNAYLKAGTARKRAQTRDFIQSALAFFAEETLVPQLASRWNATPETLPTISGILDYSGDEIITRPPREGEFYRDPLPYNAEDVLDSGTPASFILTMFSYFADPEVRRTAIEGLSLAVANKGSRTFQLWHGEAGANGKNTLLDILRAILPGRVGTIGGSSITRGQDGGAKRFGAAELEGKTFAAVDEVSGAFDVPEVKRLTGSSTLSIERKGRDPYEIPQRWALAALTNRLPSFAPATDSAFLQRLLILPFDTVFYFNEIQKEEYLRLGIEESRLMPAQSKEELLAAMERERPAILRYLINQYQEMRRAGGRPYECGKSLLLKQAYQSANDLVAAFFLEHFHRDQTGRVEYARIMELWKEYTGDKGSSTREVLKRLMDRFPWITKHKSNSKHYLQGMREGEPEEKTPQLENEKECLSAEGGVPQLRERKMAFSTLITEKCLVSTLALKIPENEDPLLPNSYDEASQVYEILKSRLEDQAENLRKAGIDTSNARVLFADLKAEAARQGILEDVFLEAWQTLQASGLVTFQEPYAQVAAALPEGVAR